MLTPIQPIFAAYISTGGGRAADAPRARDEFLRAVELDPQFAKAHAYLANAYQAVRFHTGGDYQQLESLAHAALDRALKLDPQLGDAWWIKWKFVEREKLRSPIAPACSSARSRPTRPIRR